MDSQAFLGIKRSTNWHELEVGDQAYWCVFKSYGAAAGDFVALYYTGNGISQIYKITAAHAPNRQWRCSERGMLTVPTELLFSLNEPITAREMKSDSVLQEAGFVRRNFQATSFRISDKEWIRILKLMSNSNDNVPEPLERLIRKGGV